MFYDPKRMFDSLADWAVIHAPMHDIQLGAVIYRKEPTRIIHTHECDLLFNDVNVEDSLLCVCCISDGVW